MPTPAGDVAASPAIRRSASADTHSTVLTTRLVHEAREFGCLGVALDVGLVPDEAELGLVEEVGCDIAFALHALERQANLETERLLTKRICEAMPEVLLVFDPSTSKAVRWNGELVRVSGYSNEEIAAAPWRGEMRSLMVLDEGSAFSPTKNTGSST